MYVIAYFKFIFKYDAKPETFIFRYTANPELCETFVFRYASNPELYEAQDKPPENSSVGFTVINPSCDDTGLPSYDSVCGVTKLSYNHGSDDVQPPPYNQIKSSFHC